MFNMFNLSKRANQLLAGAWMLSWCVFMVTGVVLVLDGNKVSRLFDSEIILGCCAGMAVCGGVLLLLVAVQDALTGETWYTVKGQLLTDDGVTKTFELLTKNAVRRESPWTFWAVVLAKGLPGLLVVTGLLLFARLAARP